MNAATWKPDTIADDCAPAAPCATTSTGCSGLTERPFAGRTDPRALRVGPARVDLRLEALPEVQDLLRGLGERRVPVSHEGLDGVPGKPTEHLRALLQHHGLLPQRDPYLPRFEQWINAKLDGLPDEVRQPVQHFATWHHLRRPARRSARTMLLLLYAQPLVKLVTFRPMSSTTVIPA